MARRNALMASVELAGARTERAVALLTRAREAAPMDPYVLNLYLEAHLAVAKALYDRARYDEAASIYELMLSELTLSGPGHPMEWRANYGLGLCELARRDLEQAHESFRLSINSNPNNVEAYYNLARTSRLAGRIEESVSFYQQVLEIRPHPGAAHDLGRIYLETGRNLDRALELAEMAASMDERELTLNTLGWAYYSAGDHGRARDVLRRALEINELSSEALYRLGLVELADGRRGRGRDYLERAAGLHRQDRFTEEARRKLQAPGGD
jgi:tetratricopeptide (TPR) repeat protein